VDDSELSPAGGAPWWEESDPRAAHEKYLQAHRSDTNRAKIAIATRLMSGCAWDGRSVLEYGCGGGFFTIWMAKRGARVTAIEMNPKAIAAVNYYAAAEGVSDRVTVVRGNAECDTAEGEYDFIFAKDLIEHLEDDRPFFRRLGQQLRPGGGVYLATQNDHSLNYLLEGWYERVYRRNTAWCGWDRTHRRFYNAGTLGERLRDVGIAPRSWASSYLVPWRFLGNRLMGSGSSLRRLAAVDDLLGTLHPFARWGWSIMVLGRKEP
jgi:2-polyprenyl-6-hydroxyphenyl methylase/3-demethylubiquinone-9 3-methyltransferase